MTVETYKGVSYSLDRSTSSTAWRWTVHLGGNAYKTGFSCSEQLAATRAFQTIDLMLGTPTSGSAVFAPFSCRAAALAVGCLPDEGICAFEFPWCEGCPRSSGGMAPFAAAGRDDPMKSAILRGWINGMGSTEK